LTGLFADRLLSNFLNKWVSLIVVGIYIVLFFVLATSIFNVIDIAGYVKMFAPTISLSKRNSDDANKNYNHKHKPPSKAPRMR
jgi:hypothetical protein